jgi:hypothetical protein
MQPQTYAFTQARLGAFLADHVGTLQSEDVGALLGQASLLYDSPVADPNVPSGWHAALTAALCGESPAQ